jgi:phage/plasmid-associated DNA primase
LTDKALYERVRLIPFQLSFVEKPTKKYERKKDDFLDEKFDRQENKEGILKWIIDASVYYHDNRDNLTTPKIVNEERERYRKDMDIHRDFIDETYNLIDIPEEQYRYTVTRKELLAQYKEYCRANNAKFSSKKDEEQFDKILKVDANNKMAKRYIGIVSKDECVDDELD